MMVGATGFEPVTSSVSVTKAFIGYWTGAVWRD
jgi:hypothetical protein